MVILYSVADWRVQVNSYRMVLKIVDEYLYIRIIFFNLGVEKFIKGKDF